MKQEQDCIAINPLSCNNGGWIRLSYTARGDVVKSKLASHENSCASLQWLPGVQSICGNGFGAPLAVQRSAYHPCRRIDAMTLAGVKLPANLIFIFGKGSWG
jgi:hypothetical protein